MNVLERLAERGEKAREENEFSLSGEQKMKLFVGAEFLVKAGGQLKLFALIVFMLSLITSVVTLDHAVVVLIIGAGFMEMGYRLKTQFEPKPGDMMDAVTGLLGGMKNEGGNDDRQEED